MTEYHQPVLLAEVIQNLQVTPGKWYVDGTLGTGGHTKEILDQGGKVIGIDQDKRAIKIAQERLIDYSNLTIINDNFNNLSQILASQNVSEVEGILVDFGTSYIQLEDGERGFSFSHDAVLDMRMNDELQVTAKDLVNALSEKELYVLFTKYSQEQHARAISKNIVSARELKPIESTAELAEICERAYGARTTKLHPATKVFQALRMAVNDEVNVIREMLPQAEKSLSPGGRLLAISFHEVEDRIVKQFIRDSKELVALTKKPIMASIEEEKHNPRSRSAKLRVAEKART